MSQKEYTAVNRLIDTYQQHIPRYTSYPTAVELCESDDASSIIVRNLAHQPVRERALYIHIPFCSSLCYFCACNKIISTDPGLRRSYLEALRKECRTIRGTLSNPHPISSLHIGGGSPSVLTVGDLHHLMGTISESFELAVGAAKSIELDPRTVVPERIGVLRELGFSRASLGIQDLDPDVQSAINRVQPFEQIAALTENLRSNGIADINFDLIYGLPLQTEASMRTTMERVIQLRPDRIALYGYAHVAWKVKVQRALEKYHLPDSHQRFTLFNVARERLVDAGYSYIGMDHFALPDSDIAQWARQGLLRRNFMGYVGPSETNVIGVGASALSNSEEVMYQNEPDVGDYITRTATELPVKKLVWRSLEDEIRGRMIERILCLGHFSTQGLARNHVESELIDTLLEGAHERLTMLAQDGMIVWCGPKEFSVPHTMRFFLRTVASLFDRHLAQTRISIAAQTYSSSV